jgi:hypothetical protein
MKHRERPARVASTQDTTEVVCPALGNGLTSQLADAAAVGRLEG